MKVTFGSLNIFILYLLFFVHYVQPQVMFGFSGNIPLFTIVSSVMVGLLLLNENSLRCLKYKQIQWILVLLALLTFLVCFSPIKGEAVKVLKAFYVQCVFVISVAILIDTIQKLKSLIEFLCLTTLFLIFYTLINQAEFNRNSFSPLSNFLTDPNDYSLFLNMMIPWILLSFFNSKRLKKLIFGIGLLAAIIVDILTFSRGGLMGLIVIIMVLLTYHPRRYQFMFIVPVFILIGLSFLSETWFSVMGTTTNLESSTTQSRVIMWVASWNIFVDNLLGVGPGGIGAIASSYIPDGELGFSRLHWYGAVCHSFWFTALAEWGIIGLGILFYIIKLNTRDCKRLIRISKISENSRYFRELGVSALASLLGFLMSATFLTVNYYPHFWYLTALICVSSKIGLDEYQKILDKT